jgi:hypothetical protein
MGKKIMSMGANAATKVLRVMDNLERILAIELMNASQAIAYRKLRSSDFIEMFLKSYRAEVPLVTEDRILHYDIEQSIAFSIVLPLKRSCSINAADCYQIKDPYQRRGSFSIGIKVGSSAFAI